MVSSIFPLDSNVSSEPRSEADRSFLPLSFPFDSAVHKSQGQTLTRVKIDLQRTFEKGARRVSFLFLRASLEDESLLTCPSSISVSNTLLAQVKPTCESSSLHSVAVESKRELIRRSSRSLFVLSAVSRCTSLDTLQIINYLPSK